MEEGIRSYAPSASYTTVVVGTEAAHNDLTYVNLLQTNSIRSLYIEEDSTNTTYTIVCSLTSRTGCINYYLNAKSLNGIVISLFAAVFLIFGFL